MPLRNIRRALAAVALSASAAHAGQREPVLKQVAHPHPYYFRELYLPQATGGPSAAAWSPDGREVVYSMRGSLWRQAVESDVAFELTAGPGYDYQPDWSPDGRRIGFVRYAGDALELHLLDLESGEVRLLTSGGQVNVEPRFSPDGTRLAFVSTEHNGRFHIFVARMEQGRLLGVERLTGETVTDRKRYYYGAADHEISPSWSPDGREILFVSNRGASYGAGGLWRMRAEPGAEPRPVLDEETTWKARPDWSRDGRRVVYASYDRRQWHNLWLTTPEGGAPFALTFGEHDDTAPRWSPDGRRIAFVSNRGGDTSLWVIEAVGGRQHELRARERRYLRPMGTLRLAVLDAAGRPTEARVFLTGADGRAYAPDGAWMRADDSFVRGEQAEEARYFHLAGEAEVAVPAGTARVVAMRGFAREPATAGAKVAAGETAELRLRLEPLPSLPGGGRLVSADLHVHMNYTGTYRNTPERMLAQARAEDLDLVYNLIVNKEQRVPDAAYFSGLPDPASTTDHVLSHGQEFHTSYWGHLGLLGLREHLLIPDYAAYPETAAASLYPSNSAVADLAHAQGALVGYVHPYEISDLPDPSAALNHAFPVDVALGKVDYFEVLGFSDHRSTAEIWYRLLNLGYRIPAAAGTDAMANYASLRGPVGTNRTYARLPEGPVRSDLFLEELRRGRTFATNGPLLDFTLGGARAGEELRLGPGRREVPYTAALRSIVPVDHLEIVCNGRVVADLPLDARSAGADTGGGVGERRPGTTADPAPDGSRTLADHTATLPLDASGWCLLRAWNEGPAFPILDAYPYATTSPVYLEVEGSPLRSPADARFFVAWVDRLLERAAAHPDWNTEAEREEVLAGLRAARAAFAARAES